MYRDIIDTINKFVIDLYYNPKTNTYLFVPQVLVQKNPDRYNLYKEAIFYPQETEEIIYELEDRYSELLREIREMYRPKEIIEVPFWEKAGYHSKESFLRDHTLVSLCGNRIADRKRLLLFTYKKHYFFGRYLSSKEIFKGYSSDLNSNYDVIEMLMPESKMAKKVNRQVNKFYIEIYFNEKDGFILVPRIPILQKSISHNIYKQVYSFKQEETEQLKKKIQELFYEILSIEFHPQEKVENHYWEKTAYKSRRSFALNNSLVALRYNRRKISIGILEGLYSGAFFSDKPDFFISPLSEIQDFSIIADKMVEATKKAYEELKKKQEDKKAAKLRKKALSATKND